VISGTTPLAIELALAGGPGQPRWGKTAGHAPLRLIARPVRPGKNGGWVGGDLSWGRLDALRYSGDYREEQVRLLRELYVLYQARGGRGGYYGYSYGDDRSIELSAVGSRRPACGWCTRASAACCPDTATPSSAWMSPAARPTRCGSSR
jgi:hypothetical protein